MQVIYKPAKLKKMKTLMNSGLFVLLLMILSPSNSFAQAEVVFDNTFTFVDKKGDVFESIESLSVVTPGGTILKSAVFQLPEGHELIPEKGKQYIPVGLKVVDINGEEQYLINYNIKVGKDGKFKTVLHLNGSGSVFPVGW